MRSAVFVFVILCSCTANHSTESTVEEAASGKTSPENTASLSVTSRGSYIGFIQPLLQTHEFSIPLYFLNEQDFLEAAELDSIVYQDDALIRKYVPEETAVESFDLANLDEVVLYNEHHQALGIFKRKRVEYAESLIESGYYAVYDAPGDLHEDELLYAISSPAPQFDASNFVVEEQSGNEISSGLLQSCKLDESKPWVMYHYKVSPADITFSTLSSGDESYLVESSQGNTRIVLKETDFNLGRIVPLPLLVNAKPVLLVNGFVPESDVTGSYVAIFDGASYHAATHSKVDIAF